VIRSDVSASEAATYAFCAKAWHLEHVTDCSPSEAARELRRSGIASHLTYGTEFGSAHRLAAWRSRVVVGLVVTSWVLVVTSILLSKL
jgi:hypothetical protein